MGRAGSISPIKCDRRVKWSTEEYIAAHREVVRSGLHNFQGCKIPIPTKIRFDRMRAALGNEVTSKELKMLDLLKYGMPLNCKPGYGISKPQKNHQSAIGFKDAISTYLNKNIESQAMLGPFVESPIAGICFSPLMSVPKEETK